MHRGGVSFAMHRLTGLLPILAVAVLWEAVSRLGLTSPVLLPPFSVVIQRLARLTVTGELPWALWVTTYRSFIGLFIAAVVGMAVGLAMARVLSVRWFFNPVVAVGFPLPTITLLPAFTIWFGSGDESKIWLVALTCFFPIAVSTFEGARNMNRQLLWSAQSMGSHGIALFRRVILPASVPFVFSGVRVALPLAVIVTFVAEMVGGGGGLGFLLIYGYRFLQTPTVLAALVAVLIFGVLLDQLLLWSRRVFLPWDASDRARDG
ncbi:ABC transporter permease [Saxibacter everestensis]|uniref:ABC transporter permease n=1 Tax=Saxibacter everestensis TaxID=2909229 RepID=A0ABY8QU16_9MICO|nr:ABC transporter permease [Brevibacteriaceae bacterium ZFBP1038]